MDAVYSTDDDNVSSPEALRRISGMELLALAMSIPAILCSIWCLKNYSIKNLQVYGFWFITFNFVLLGSLFSTLRGKYSDVLYTIYCILLFSLSFGPNLSTFILPAQTYPKKVRATLNGVSAACGKLGAFAGVYMFGPIADQTSYPTVMIICAIVSAAGALITQFCLHPIDDLPVTERKTKGMSKEEEDIGFIHDGLVHHLDEDVEDQPVFHRGSFG